MWFNVGVTEKVGVAPHARGREWESEGRPRPATSRPRPATPRPRPATPGLGSGAEGHRGLGRSIFSSSLGWPPATRTRPSALDLPRCWRRGALTSKPVAISA